MNNFYTPKQREKKMHINMGLENPITEVTVFFSRISIQLIFQQERHSVNCFCSNVQLPFIYSVLFTGKVSFLKDGMNYLGTGRYPQAVIQSSCH
jgi:hypothetical protein